MTNSANSADRPGSVSQALDRARIADRAARDEQISADISRGERLAKALSSRWQREQR